VTNLADPKPRLSVVQPDAAPDTGRGWRTARRVVRWLATAMLVGWLAVSVDWHAVGPAFAKASVPWLLLAATLYIASQCASVLRWEILVRASGLVHPRTRLFAAYFEGMFVNVCLPTTMGGDVLKVLRVGGSQHKRVATSTVLADRATGFAALLMLLAAGLLVKFDRVGQVAGLLLGAVIVVSLPVAYWLFRYGIDSLHPLIRVRGSKLHRQFTRFVPLGIRQLLIQTPWLRVMFWAFVVQSLNIALVGAAAYSIGLNVAPVEILVAATTVSIAAALPISIAGVGVREVSLPLLLAADGVPRELAITLGIALSGIALGGGLLGGPFHFLAQRAAARERENSVPATTVAARRSA
jgi:uncharacterized protein (TIRG00374 family)